MILWVLLPVEAETSGLRLEGNAEQGGLLIGYAPPGSMVRVDETDVRVSEKGVFLVGFGHDAPDRTTIEVTHLDGTREVRSLGVNRRTYQVQRIDGLPEKKVTPPPEVTERIAAEARRVSEARARNDPRTDFLTGFMWPVSGPITGVYGTQRILNGHPRQPHFGIDIGAPVGTTVLAPADGFVTLVEPDLYYSGGTLILDHGHGLSSTFLHLSRILVHPGQVVRRGEAIAEVGATGRATGAHLDWRMNLLDARIDPGLLMSR